MGAEILKIMGQITLNQLSNQKERQEDHQHIRKQMMFWRNTKLKALVNEFNTIACEIIEINKVGKKKSKASATNGDEMTKNKKNN